MTDQRDANYRLFSRTDWAIAVALFVIGFGLRIPFRSALAYHWDSAQFALAIREYNVALSQPHAPGYFLYVMLGRLVNVFVGDPHASLVWISVAFGSALCGLLYLLGTAMFGRRAGLVAGLLVMTSPQTWFHSCVALTYIVDAFLVCLMVLWCWRAMAQAGTWGDAVAIGVLLAVLSGVRQQSVPALVPLVLLTFWKFGRQRGLKLLVAVAVSVAVVLVWFVPMVRMSGGLPLYMEIVRLHARFNAPATFIGGGWNALLHNIAFVTIACGNGLMLGTVVLAAMLVYPAAARLPAERKRACDAANAPALQMLAIWLVPMLVFGTIGFTKQPGYVLSYLPVLLLLVGVALAQLRRRWVFAGIMAILCAANVFAFVAWPRSWDGIFFGIGRTAREIRQHDAKLAMVVDAARAHFDPQKTLVIHAEEHLLFGLRHFQLYLPEFEGYQLWPDPTVVSPPGKPFWRTRNGHLEFVGAIDLSGKNTLLLVVPPGEDVGRLKPFWSRFTISSPQPVKDSKGVLYVLPLRSQESVQMLNTER